MRRPEMTTGHVVVGALTLADTFWLTWLAHRDIVEGHAPLATPSAPASDADGFNVCAFAKTCPVPSGSLATTSSRTSSHHHSKKR